MALLNTKQREKIPGLYSQEEIEDPTVFLIIRIQNAFWLITEVDEKGEIAFGWADMYGDGSCGELGYISLEEIEKLGEKYFVSIREINTPLSKKKEKMYQ